MPPPRHATAALALLLVSARQSGAQTATSTTTRTLTQTDTFTMAPTNTETESFTLPSMSDTNTATLCPKQKEDPCTTAADCSGHATMVKQLNGVCQCKCSNQWTGDTCALCPDRYDSGNNCGSCAAGYVGTYPSCTQGVHATTVTVSPTAWEYPKKLTGGLEIVLTDSAGNRLIPVQPPLFCDAALHRCDKTADGSANASTCVDTGGTWSTKLTHTGVCNFTSTHFVDTSFSLAYRYRVVVTAGSVTQTVELPAVQCGLPQHAGAARRAQQLYGGALP
eukprot:TRINITY_DN14711_c0_g1_i1.p1 TRINITY_DN14711_c0_g1~~TRINITY_DN14711_c0_g1_i1.p1  ORF type:complete len:309 (+),score=75.96 TRINITY_DN14711_c0_g1_i1:96-929(+)